MMIPASRTETHSQQTLQLAKDLFDTRLPAYQENHFRWRSRQSWALLLYHMMVLGLSGISGYFFKELSDQYFDDPCSNAHKLFPESSMGFWRILLGVCGVVSNAFLATFCVQDATQDLISAYRALRKRNSDSSDVSAKDALTKISISTRAKVFNRLGKTLVISMTLSSFIMTLFNMKPSGKDPIIKKALEYFSALANTAVFYISVREFEALQSTIDALRYASPQWLLTLGQTGEPGESYTARKVIRQITAELHRLKVECEHHGIADCSLRAKLLKFASSDMSNPGFYNSLLVELLNDIEAEPFHNRIKEIRDLDTTISNAQRQNQSTLQLKESLTKVKNLLLSDILFTLDHPLKTPVNGRQITASTRLLDSEAQRIIAGTKTYSKSFLGYTATTLLLSFVAFMFYRWIVCILSGLGYASEASEEFRDTIEGWVRHDNGTAPMMVTNSTMCSVTPPNPYSEYSPWANLGYVFTMGLSSISNIGICYASSQMTYDLIVAVIGDCTNSALRKIGNILNYFRDIPVKMGLPHYQSKLRKSLDYHLAGSHKKWRLPFIGEFTVNAPFIWIFSQAVVFLPALFAWAANDQVNKSSLMKFFNNDLGWYGAFWQFFSDLLTSASRPGTVFVNYYFGILYVLKSLMDFHYFGKLSGEAKPSGLSAKEERELRTIYNAIDEYIKTVGAMKPANIKEYLNTSVESEHIKKMLENHVVSAEDLEEIHYDVDSLGELDYETTPKLALKNCLFGFFSCRKSSSSDFDNYDDTSLTVRAVSNLN